jgi:hypothetical protein
MQSGNRLPDDELPRIASGLRVTPRSSTLCARQAEAHLHPTLDIADAQLAAMQLGHLLDEVEAQAGAFAAAAGARQGVEAFDQARLC